MTWLPWFDAIAKLVETGWKITRSIWTYFRKQPRPPRDLIGLVSLLLAADRAQFQPFLRHHSGHAFNIGGPIVNIDQLPGGCIVRVLYGQPAINATVTFSQKEARVLNPVKSDGWWHLSFQAELDPSYFHLSDPINLYFYKPMNVAVSPRGDNNLPEVRRL